MEPNSRARYNAAYTDAFYADYVAELERRLSCTIPFRVAETPFFIPPALRDSLADDARGIVEQITKPELISELKKAIPPKYDVPRMDALPNCLQVDFAITKNADGVLEGKVVELQAFPSLYALMVVQSRVMSDMLASRMGMKGPWGIYFGGLDEATFVEKLTRAIVGDADPETTVLLDLHPEKQKTFPDFAATKILTGVDAVCPTKLRKVGNQLFREKDGKSIPVRRVYNRIVFDELDHEGTKLPFSYTDDLDLTWCSHPNWYWVFSKYTMPYVNHRAVPKARTVASLTQIPSDLEGYVLKPLFSFAGAGVKVDVTREDLDSIPESERAHWLLQEKIVYEPGIPMADGSGQVKAEVRMMFLRGPHDDKLELVLNLVRLSRGKMLGVDQNKNLTWVGGSVGLFNPEDA